MTIDFDAFNREVTSKTAFGGDVTYTLAGGASKVIEGVFDNAYLAAQGLGDAGVGTSSPAITVLSSDVVGVSRGDTVVVGGTTYYVVEPQPNGSGLTVLILSRNA